MVVMSDFLRIPFGKSKINGEWVDVHDVPSGLACDCICPSCETPLVARKGNEREWHFAHAPKGVYDKTKSECEYSAYVSIALMTKQLFLKCGNVSLPTYNIRLPVRDKFTQKIVIFTDSKVTEASVVSIQSCSVETYYLDIKVDILTYVKSVPLAFYLIHPERVLPVNKDDFKGRTIGVVSINLGIIANALRQASGTSGGYLNCLAKLLFEDSLGKEWVYHTRQEKILSDWDKDRIKEWHGNGKSKVRDISLSAHNLKISEFNIPDYSKLRYRFKCQGCGSEWNGSNVDRKCPSCGEFLYTKELSVG